MSATLRTPRRRTALTARARLSYPIRIAIAGMLALAMASPASVALAWRAPGDQVAGRPLSAGAVPAAAAPNIDAAAGILVSSDGRVLWSRGKDQRRAMASTTKMMTALLAIEHGHLNDMVAVPSDVTGVEYGIGLQPGEKLPVRGVLELALVASSNDAAYTLGIKTAGSMPKFVAMMNERARKLGLSNTHFVNPHGLDAPGHFSTPADLAKLAQADMQLPEFRRIVSLRAVRLPAYRGRPAQVLKSTDRLLGVYPGLNGVKTGFTGNAGYSFVSQATRGNVTLTAVILGANSEPARFEQTRRLLDWGFSNLQVRTVTAAGEQAGSVPLPGTAGARVPLLLGDTVTKPVFALDGPITRETSVTPQVKLPVLLGQPLGQVRVRQGARVLAQVPALAATSTLSAEETVGVVPVADYHGRTVTARTAPVAVPSAPKFDPKAPVQQRLRLKSRVSAPVSAGEPLGEITYSQGGRVVARVAVVAAESVERPRFFASFWMALANSWSTFLAAF